MGDSNQQDAAAYNKRAFAWYVRDKLDNALKDLTAAIQLDPENAGYYGNRGYVWYAKGEFDNALKDYTEAIRLDPGLALAYINLAWLRATCPDEQYRDGEEAVSYATKACELSAWKSWSDLETLAAAYAEAGDFTNAVNWQEKMIELSPEGVRQAANERLKQYRMKQPCRDAIYDLMVEESDEESDMELSDEPCRDAIYELSLEESDFELPFEESNLDED